MFCSCIASINADYGIIQQIPNTNTNISSSTTQFSLQSRIYQQDFLLYVCFFSFVLVNQTVNRPSFPTFIYFINAITNASIYQIDAHADTVNVTYSTSTLTFHTSGFNDNDEFYITFDAGVLFSNGINSSAITDHNFWHLKVIDIQTTTSVTNTVAYTSMETTQQVSTGTSMMHQDSTMTHTTQNVNTTSVNVAAMITGRK